MNTATIIGNLTDEPLLRYTTDGKPVANMTVAVSRRVRRDGEWTDQLDGYFDVVAFGTLGEHAADSLAKGTRVLVAGRLQQDSYEDRQGVRRTAVQLVAEDIAPALRFATAQVTKASSDDR